MHHFSNWIRSLVLCALVATASAADATAQWLYGAPVEITNNGPALSDYQVAITLDTETPIAAGKMLADGADIRFADGSCTQLPYWIESGINTTTTKVWVRVPSIAANDITTIYLQYGNASATAVSDPNATFIFYDNFSGAAIDAAKWEVSGGGVSVGGGTVTVSAGSTIRTAGSHTRPIAFDVAVTAYAGSLPMTGQYLDGTTNGYFMTVDAGSVFNGPYFDVGWISGGSGSIWFGASAGTTGVWSFGWSSTTSQLASWPGGRWPMTLTNWTHGDVDGFIRMYNYNGASLTADWARTRAFAASEPTTTIGAEGVMNSTASVTLSPVSNTAVCSGGSVSFTANATGYTAVQWQRSTDGGATWRNVVGATSTTYTIDPTMLAMNGHQFRAAFDPSACNGPRTGAATLTLNGAPSMTVTLSPATIAYRQLGKMRTIHAALSPSGLCGPFTTQLVSITANEPIAAGDVQFASFGTTPADLSFNVAPNRNGAETPRIYTVTYRVTDASGNSTDVSATVTVPLVGGM